MSRAGPAARDESTRRLSHRAEILNELLAHHRADLAAIDRLKPDERTALLLLGLGDSYAEIGEMQGWTQTKVNRCVAEGRSALRAERVSSVHPAVPHPS